MENKCTLTNEELIAKCKAWVKSLCETGARSWSLSVPVNLDKDPDILFMELADRLAATPPPQGLADGDLGVYENFVAATYANGTPAAPQVEHIPVMIKCPECETVQAANVINGVPFATYIHKCSNCKYTIIESEWQEVKPYVRTQIGVIDFVVWTELEGWEFKADHTTGEQLYFNFRGDGAKIKTPEQLYQIFKQQNK